MGTKYFVDGSSLTEVADAIRARTGNNDSISFPEGFKSAIADIATPLLPLDEYPRHVREEATRVVHEVHKVLKDDSVIFIALSDAHRSETKNYESIYRASMATKALTSVLPIDFVCHLGDVAAADNHAALDTDAKAAIAETLNSEITGYLNEACNNLPVFRAVGNHDAEDSGLPGTWFYNNFTLLAKTTEDSIGGDPEGGGYCYRDFDDKKLRVFLLNTCEKTLKYGGIEDRTMPFGEQQLWLANKILELNEKDDPSNWGFIILSHHPADYGDVMPLSNLLEAYVSGKSFTITDASGGWPYGDGTNASVDFTGKNYAKFIAQFHGHIHNFLESRLYAYNTSTKKYEPYDANRVCVSSTDTLRINHDTNHFKRGFSFSDPEGAQAKTPDSATETSFTVNVINRSENMIHSFNYGAGYYRPIDLTGIPYYHISTELANATITAEHTAVKENDAYTATVSVNDGCTLQYVKVTMGGEDITTDVYTEADGSIIIPNVTGAIHIEVKAKAAAVNLLPLAIADAAGTPYVGDNGEKGYRVGYRISSGNLEKAANMCCTGYMPIHPDAVIRIKNVEVPTTGYDAPYENLSFVATPGSSHLIFIENDENWPSTEENGVITIKVADAANASTTPQNLPNVKYFRFCCKTITENTIVTVDEFE
jgi:hypothetical protein